jgi:hypothetical protein
MSIARLHWVSGGSEDVAWHYHDYILNVAFNLPIGGQ